MRILVLQESNWIERGPHQQHHLIERMSLRGHEIRVIDYDILWPKKPNRKILKPREDFGYVHKIFPDARIRLIRPAIIQMPILDYLSIPVSHGLEILKQIREFRPHVIISFGILNAFVGVMISKRGKIPYVYYLIDHLHTLIPFQSAIPIARFFEKKTMQSADRVLVINKGLGEYATSMCGDAKKISIITGGIDLSNYAVGGEKRKEMRKKYGIRDDDLVLFFMGWLYHFSGLKEVATTLAEMGEKALRLKLLIVGEGDAFQDLIAIKSQKLNENLILTGKQPFANIPSFLAAADICILPAYPNAPEMQNIVPIKIYEYMAAGKPVISTRLPGIVKEFGYDNGIVYVDHPQDALMKAMEMMKNDKLELEGQKARKFVQNNDWSVITEQFQNFLIEVCKA
jgi:glycosyltransferase involved in cell wall biosynthesis